MPKREPLPQSLYFGKIERHEETDKYTYYMAISTVRIKEREAVAHDSQECSREMTWVGNQHKVRIWTMCAIWGKQGGQCG